MCTAPVLRMPDFSKSFIIETDACMEGMGAVLMQEGGPIAYLSKAFNSKNKGLSTYEKELMALVQAVTKWRHYLIGQHFIIRTNHQSLKHLLEKKLTTPMQHKWLSKLWGLDYEIHYKQGADNRVADALSRRGHWQEQGSLTIISSVKPDWITQVEESYVGD